MPETTVAALMTRVENDTTYVLLTCRADEPFKGQWCLPGGHIEPYETARDAVIREAKEETGLDFEPHFRDYSDEILPEQGLHAVVLVFKGYGSGSLAMQEAEVTDIRWFPLEEAAALPLAFNHNAIVAAYADELPF